jgi:hypothetical protein
LKNEFFKNDGSALSYSQFWITRAPQYKRKPVMLLKGKKCFCFVALKHHSRFLLPITRVLEAEGVDVRYLTAPAEMPFEITLMEEGLSYTHPFSYLTPEVAEKVESAYRQVRMAWREKMLASPLLNYYIIPLQDKTLRLQVENFYLFRQMFEQEKPDFVLALHELNSWGKLLGYLSHEYKIPSITLQEGLYYAPTGVYRFHTEYSTACLVWGEATREVLVRSGGSADKIFVVGNTHLASAIAQATHPEAVQETKKELQLAPGRKVVVILMGGVGYQDEFAFPAEFVNWVRDTSEYTVVCKWHPQTNRNVIDRIESGFGNSPHLRFVQHYDTYQLLAVSDVCVVFGNSTTGLEALAFDKPLIEVLIPGLEYSFAAQGVAEGVIGLSAVPAAVQHVFTHGVSTERSQKVKEYLEQNLAETLDGRSVERAVDLISRMLAIQEEQQQRWQPNTKFIDNVQQIDPHIFAPSSSDESRTRIDNIQNLAAPVLSEHQSYEFLCSIIIPLESTEGVGETLLGIARHTSSDLSYECLLSSAYPDEVRQLLSGIQGDIHLLSASYPSIAHLCNVAAKAAKGRYLCFVPPGLIPQAGWLEGLLKELDTESTTGSAQLPIGIVGGQSVFTNGLLSHAGIAFDANCSLSLLYRLLPATFVGANKARVVPAVTGCVLIPREVFAMIGGMDEGFQHLFHDIDFCLQAQVAGWQTKYTPHSTCLSFAQNSTRGADDRLRFYSKWVGYLWPNEEKYWQEDDLDNKKLIQLYQQQLH